MATIIDFIKEKRIESGLSIREFCKQCNLDASNWSKIEKGIRNMNVSIETFNLISKVLKLSNDDHKEMVGIMNDTVKTSNVLPVSEDNLLSKSKPRKKLKYNDGRIPDWKDGILRFRDPDNGLWKRCIEWPVTYKMEDGKRVKDNKGNEIRIIHSKWDADTGEIHTDDIGEFFIAKCGEKVYLFSK